jgi:hypothetical protein
MASSVVLVTECFTVEHANKKINEMLNMIFFMIFFSSANALPH